MNDAHLHLLLNHVPILGTLFGVLVLGFGLLAGNRSLTRTGLVTFIATALLALPAYFSGEGAEEAVEHLPGVSEQLIERHEETAELAFGLVEVLGLISLGLLLLGWKYPDTERKAAWLPLALGIGTFAAMAVTGNTGGEIRHTEIRKDAPTADRGAAGEAARVSVEAEADDED